MSFSIQWYNPEKTIIYICYEHWTWHDFYKAIQVAIDLSLTVNHPVDNIAHIIDSLIPQRSAFSHSPVPLKQKNDQLGIIVVVTSSRFILGLMTFSSQIIIGWQNKYRISDTVENAREIIAKNRLRRWTA